METERYITYYRVSTQKQGADGLGIEAQKEAVSRFTTNIIAEFTEVESGKKTNRVELNKAIRLAKKENATILVARLDRLARNVHFISTLMEQKVKFKCVDNPHMDNLTIHIFASIAQSERERISKNTKAGLNSIKERIKRDGVYVSKKGNPITHLGSSIAVKGNPKAKEHCDRIRAKRVYVQQPLHVQELIKSYREVGMTIKAIKKRLSELDIHISEKCVWYYT